MYQSILDWLDVEVKMRSFVKRDGAGDKIFKEPVMIYTYPVFETAVVKNPQGVEVTASHHYYVNGNVDVSVLDEILVDNTWRQVQSVDVFFRGGTPDLKVVHV